MIAPKLIAAGVVLSSLLLTQACSSASPTNSKAADRKNSNETPTTASVPPPPPSASQCDPNYSGCVPIASDVDCAGGRGNGPAYVKGPVTVTGKDIYKLDGDRDGIGCE